MKRVMMMVLAMMSASAMAATEWLESSYVNQTVASTGGVCNFTQSYTNTSGSKMALHSVYAMSPLATNSWSLVVVQGGQTQTLVSATALSLATTGIKYEGNGAVPLGAAGVLTVSGSVITNAGGSPVSVQVHLR